LAVIHTSRARRTGVGLCLLALAAGLPASAADQKLPEGFVAGPWILAPSFRASYGAGDNVFLRDESRAVSDRITTLGGSLDAVLPFRNSRLRFGYDVDKERYAAIEFPRDVAQVADVDLVLGFKTGDEIRIRDVYREDFARAEEVDAGGEIQSFEGEPYNLNSADIEISRDVPRRQGYTIRVRRRDFRYLGTRDIGFFDYSGFSNVFEYRQPLSDERSWVARYEARRYNHYDPFGIEAPSGVPFRKELSDAVLFGVRGFLGEERPYVVRLGYTRFRYEGRDESNYAGIAGLAAWRLALAGDSQLDLELVRRPLPSILSTYYINNAARAELERKWRRFESGATLEVSQNNYGDETPGCDGRRQDSTYAVEAFGGLRFHELLAFRLSVTHTKRNSNCAGGDYNATGITTGLLLGWF
jgi:hypothetical protein